MAKPDPDRPYTQRDIQNLLFERLPGARYNWLRDPEGNADVQVYGAAHLPAQPIYLYYRPSVVKMMIRLTPRRISPIHEAELWEAAEAARRALRAEGVTARRQKGNTQDTERDEQWVVTIPERLSEAAYDTLADLVTRAGECMGVEPPEE